MNFVLTSDFKTVAAEIVSLVFPKIQFQVLLKKNGRGNIAITFNNPKHFADNFIIKFYPKLKTLIISGYSKEGMVQLNYLPENNYDWRNEYGLTINKPYCIREKLEFLANKFYPVLQEFFLNEVSVKFSIYHEFEKAAIKVVERAFPQFHFNLSYFKNRAKELGINFRGDINFESEILKFSPERFHQKESIFFNVDFRSHAKSLLINTIWDDAQYLLFHNSIGHLSWNTLHLNNIEPPATFGKEFESIAIKLYPLLQEFFPG